MACMDCCCCRSALGSSFQTSFTTMQTDRDNYKSTSGAYTTMLSSANALKPSLSPIATNMDSATSHVTSMDLTTATSDINGVTASLLTAQSAYGAAAQQALGTLPDLTSAGPIGAAMGALVRTYAALGKPPAAVSMRWADQVLGSWCLCFHTGRICQRIRLLASFWPSHVALGAVGVACAALGTPLLS